MKFQVGPVFSGQVNVRDCVGQAQFVGRWLHKGGTSSTVMAMLGVQA
ncbi:three component ABC system middle component [Herbaspirillum sp. SJZ099]